MKSQNSPTNMDVWTQIELMVEGELSNSQKRDLLLQLDETPAMWRSLALAFVEQQSLKKSINESLASLSTSQPVADSPSKPEHTASKASHYQTREGYQWNGNRILRLATAACIGLLLFVFGLGVGNRQGQVAVNDLKASTSDGTTDSVPPHAPTEESKPSQSTVLASDENGVVGQLRWLSKTGVRMSPVFQGSIDQDWLASNPPTVDDKVMRQFAKAGVKVKPERKFVSLKLRDEQYTIPMDDVLFQRLRREVY